MAGNPHPVFQDGVSVEKANARAYLPLRLGNPDALRALDGSTFWLCYIQTLLSFFYRDTSDTTSEDNGSSVIVDGNGGIWKVISSGAGIAINAAGPVASRGSFDSEDPGFTYFGTDTELLYVRETAGGWSDGTQVTGPQGEPGDNGADGRNFQPDEVVPDLSGRDAYDAEAKNFAVLVESDSSNGDLPTLYFKLSATSGDWSAGSTFGSGGGDVAGDTHAATSKTTPVDADELPLVDSEASNVLKKLTWSNLKAALASTFLTPSQARERLTADRTYYVDGVNGDDINNGLASGSGHAFKKITFALAVIAATLDLAGFKVTVQVADANYTDPIVLPNVVGFAKTGDLVIQGNNATPVNVLINVSSTYAIIADGISTVWDLKDFKVQSTGYGISARSGSKARFGNINFGACAAGHIQAFGPGSVVTAISNYAVSAGGNCHFECFYGSQFVSPTLTVAISNTPNFAIAWANLNVLGSAQVHSMTFTGTGATGPRFAISNGAVCFTNGSTASSYLPGNAAGTGTNFAASPYGLYA
jgi:hypothetical protein